MANLQDRLLVVINNTCGGKRKEFARSVGSPASNVTNWLKKGQAPAAKYLTVMSTQLKVNLNWLLTGEGERFIKQAPAENGEEAVKDLTPAEEEKHVANLNQLPAEARDAVVAQVKTMAEAFDKANKAFTEGDEA